jgi:hypothetical protein
MIEITREIATKVRDVIDAGLVNGVGVAEPGKMCVEAAVCYALGLPHGDDPGCVSAPLRRLKIKLNDSSWSSDQVRTKGLRRLGVAQLGSKGVLNDAEFVKRVVEMTIRRSVPVALRSAAKVNPKHADRLEAAAVRCEREGTREAALAARTAAAAAAAYAAYAAAAYAAYDAAAYAAAAAADAAYDAAAYAAAAAAAYAAYAAARDKSLAARDKSLAARDKSLAARDKSLATYAEWVVEILIDMKAPGCEWLDLVPLAVSR